MTTAPSSQAGSRVLPNVAACGVSIAPLVPVLCAFAAGIITDRQLDPLETGTWLTLALASVTVAALSLRGERSSSVFLLVAIVGLGGAWHHHRWSDLSPDDVSPGVSETPQPAWVRGVIAEYMGTRTSEGYAPGDPARIVTRMVLEITEISDGSRWHCASGRTLLIAAGDRTDLHAGQPVELAGQLARVAGPLNPGEFDGRAYLRAQGIRLRLVVDDPAGLTDDPRGREWPFTRWLGQIRATCRSRLTERLDAGSAPLGAALILGQREEIDPEVNDAFARTGTTHLLAISGLQIQVLAVCVGLFLRICGLARRQAYVVVALVTALYAVLVGLAPSVVRSAVMTLTFCLAAIGNRPTQPANTLALAGLLTVAWNPFFLFDVGCQLSFLAIAALLWLVPLAQSGFRAMGDWVRLRFSSTPTPIQELIRQYEPWYVRILRRIGGWMFQGVVASSVVWLAALPLVALRFHLVSPIGIILNIPLIPITSLALLLGASGLGLALVWPPLGALPIRAAESLLQLTETIVRWGVAQAWGHRFVAGPPWSLVLAFYTFLILTTALSRASSSSIAGLRLTCWKIAVWSMVAGLLVPGWLLATRSRLPATVEGEMLAVGHGLAVCFRLPDGQTFLYDCGRMGDPRVGRRIIAPALWSRGITHLDAVFLSHADQDHFDALPDLMDRFPISAIVIPPGFESPQNPAASVLLQQVRRHGIPVRTIAAPASWVQSETRFAVLHPPEGWHPEAPDNARSLVLDIAQGGHHLLLTGDLDQLGLVELAAGPPLDPAVDLMLAPHHGGKSANPSWLYSWARPKAVIVSQRMPAVGSTDALTTLEQSGIPLLRTWQRGAVHFQWRSDQIITEGFLDHHDHT
ncbi:MAG: ComEC/Rec2 family competence protein [Isosphaeraceae bacterium]